MGMDDDLGQHVDTLTLIMIICTVFENLRCQLISPHISVNEVRLNPDGYNDAERGPPGSRP